MKKYLVKKIIPVTRVEVVEVLASDYDAAVSLCKRGFGVKIETIRRDHQDGVEYEAKEI
jgi:hypothetical protein